MRASGENSARLLRVLVQILLLLASRGRCSSPSPPVGQRPRRRRRTSNARKCSIIAIFCTLIISSPFALFRCLPPRPCLLLARPVCGVLRHHQTAPHGNGQHRGVPIPSAIATFPISTSCSRNNTATLPRPSEPPANRSKSPSLSTIRTLLAFSENALPATAPSSLCWHLA